MSTLPGTGAEGEGAAAQAFGSPGGGEDQIEAGLRAMAKEAQVGAAPGAVEPGTPPTARRRVRPSRGRGAAGQPGAGEPVDPLLPVDPSAAVDLNPIAPPVVSGVVENFPDNSPSPAPAPTAAEVPAQPVVGNIDNDDEPAAEGPVLNQTGVSAGEARKGVFGRVADWFRGGSDQSGVREGIGNRARAGIEALRRATENSQISQGLSSAWERVSGRLPNSERLSQIKNSVATRLAGAKILGQSVPELVIGIITGGVTKEVAKLAFSIAGLGGLPIAAGAGGLAGGVSGGLREYFRQRREGINIEEDTESSGIRSKLKNEYRRMQAADKTKIRNATLRGAVMGAIGGVVGGVVMDLINGEAVAVVGDQVSAPEVQPDAAPSGTPSPSGTEVPVQPVQGPDAVPPVSGTEAPVQPAPSLDQTPEQLLTPKDVESITLDAGSTPWGKAQEYLADQLGREPTGEEIRQAVAKLIAENNIADATNIPAGTQLDIASVNEYIGKILAEQQSVSVDLAAAPEAVSLPAGSNPWNEVSHYLEDTLGREPSNAEILSVTKEVCRQSNIAVPSWGIPGDDLHTNLSVGKVLNFNQPVKIIIGKLAA